jgi:tRNA threonylcarbamoyladenosine biosynthesis protein TsaE
MTEKILIKTEVTNISGTKNFAAQAIQHIRSGDTVLLYGDLGSGKTFLTKEFVALLGSTAEVSSPSFSLINQYDDDIHINHIDLYRINDQSDLINLGLDDLWESGSINFIEWPEIIESQIVWHHFRIQIISNPKKKNWRQFILVECHE